MKDIIAIILVVVKVVFAKMEGFIVGGQDAHIKDWPFIVFLAYYSGNTALPGGCGGSILSSQTVLTAAHCLDDVTNNKETWNSLSIFVYMGHIDIFRSTCYRLAIDYHTHSDYDVEKANHDIGVLFLEKSIEFSENVQKTVLRPQPLDWNKPADRNLKSAGWGAWSDPMNESYPLSAILQTIDQRFVPNSVCKSVINILESGTMCAGDFNSTKYVYSGDSGGPLVDSNGFQIGLVSYKPGNVNGVTIFTNIPDYFEWLRSTQEYLFKHNCS